MTKPPDNFRDIVAMILFEDVGPEPACGYAVTADDGGTLFYTKVPRGYVAWERILSWRYLDDLWPDYLTQGLENDGQYIDIVHRRLSYEAQNVD